MPRIHRRLARAGVALATAALVLGPVGAAAAPSQVAEPVVTIAATQGEVFSATDCKGVTESTVQRAIELTLTRTGGTADPLAVDLQYFGSLATTSGLPSQATIPAGSSQVTLTAAEARGGGLIVNIIDGADYAVGNPGGAITGVGTSIADLGCNIGNPYSFQTIEVGTTPATVDVEEVAYGPADSLIRTVEGTAPTGTTFQLDGTWEGVATEVGVFRLRMYFCAEDGWCPNRADIEVEVVPAGAEPPTTETPAAPVAAAPAAAVAGRPELTG